MGAKPLTEHDQLILQWAGIAVKVAREMANRYKVEFNDLYSLALLGVSDGIRTWRDGVGCSFQGWLTRLARHRCTPVVKKTQAKKRAFANGITVLSLSPRDDMEFQVAAPKEEESIHWTEREWCIVYGVLPDKLATALKLHMEGVSDVKIGKRMGWGRRSASGFRNQAIRTLQVKLTEQELSCLSRTG